jgi:hypothetical protein
MASPRAVVSAPKISGNAEDYENEHVHGVYDEIASHFSSTRYKVRSVNIKTSQPIKRVLALAYYRQIYLVPSCRIHWVRLGMWKWQIYVAAHRRTFSN